MKQDHIQFAAVNAYRPDPGEMVTRYLPLVRKLAWHFSGSGGPSVDVDDLVQAGLVALTECAQRHKEATEDGFAAYAKLRVRGAMIDLLRTTSPESRGARNRRMRLEHEQSRLAGLLGRAPSPQELAQALGLSLAEMLRMQEESRKIELQSIDECYSDSDLRFGSADADAESALVGKEDRAELVRAISGLPERLQLIIQLYFVEELNLAEIAETLGVSTPRVHQLKTAAINAIRAELDR